MTALSNALFPRQSYIVLGPVRSPGVAVVRGAGSPRTWNTPQGYGISGSSATYVGSSLSKFEVDIKLWLPEHFLEWQVFSKVLAPPLSGFGVTALGIRHPLVNGPPLGITEVVVEDVSQFSQSDTGLWTCTIKFIQYRKPQPGFSKPIAAVPAAEKMVQEKPDANDIEMGRLMVEQALKGGVFGL